MTVTRESGPLPNTRVTVFYFLGGDGVLKFPNLEGLNSYRRVDTLQIRGFQYATPSAGIPPLIIF